MRENMGLFRGYSKSYNRWIYGNLVFTMNADGEREPAILTYGINYNDTYYDVEPESVGECTGLKDKNGNLIFEGDIFVFDEDKTLDEEAFIVKWNDQFSGLALLVCSQFPVTKCRKSNAQTEIIKYTGWEILLDNDLSKYEIISNIYEHPELLKGE